MLPFFYYLNKEIKNTFFVIFTEFVERECEADGFWMPRPGFSKSQNPKGLLQRMKYKKIVSVTKCFAFI